VGSRSTTDPLPGEKAPVLTPDQVEALGGFPPPTAISERLAQENLNLARARASLWARRCSQPYEDLEAVAFRGLLNGCRRFDPGRGAQLSTFCHTWINGAIQQYLRDRSHLIKYPMRWRENWGKVSHALAAEGATLASVAKALKLQEQEVRDMVQAMGSGIRPLNEFDAAPETGVDLSPVDLMREKLQAAFRAIANSDQQSLRDWFDRPKRVPPQHSVQQFIRQFQAALRGVTLAEARQLSLLDLGAGWEHPGRSRRPRSQKPRRSYEEIQQACIDASLLTRAELNGTVGREASQSL
jgi:DNA-directed RNA polymerase specialized sigma subunit